MNDDALQDLLARITRAELALTDLMNAPGALADRDRLQGKREGVRLAASYVNDAIREAQA